MKKFLWPTAMAAMFASTGALAQDMPMGRVISSTPVVQQVAVPQQVCTPQQVVTPAPNSGAGAALGAIAGGLLGNAAGHGPGRGAATVAGAIGGALVGNAVEGSRTQVSTVNGCYTQTTYANQTVAYNVVYEYAGRQYQTQLDHDPGATIALQVSPSAGTNNLSPAPAPAPTYVTTPPTYYSSPDVVYSYPYYVEPAVAPSIFFSVGGGWGHGGPHRGWR